MNVEIGTEAVHFPAKEYINGIFVAVCFKQHHLSSLANLTSHPLHISHQPNSPLQQLLLSIKKTPLSPQHQKQLPTALSLCRQQQFSFFNDTGLSTTAASLSTVFSFTPYICTLHLMKRNC
jgi:hypothetical protein